MPAAVKKAEGVALLLPIMGVVFVAFLVIGIAMPVLPLHVHDGLGQSTFVVGLIGGSQFAASLISGPMAGHSSDTRTAKRGVIVGLLAAEPIPRADMPGHHLVPLSWRPRMFSARVGTPPMPPMSVRGPPSPWSVTEPSD